MEESARRGDEIYERLRPELDCCLSNRTNDRSRSGGRDELNGLEERAAAAADAAAALWAGGDGDRHRSAGVAAGAGGVCVRERQRHREAGGVRRGARGAALRAEGEAVDLSAPGRGAVAARP